MRIRHNLKIKRYTLSNGMSVVLVKTSKKSKLAAVVVKKGNDAYLGTIDSHPVPNGVAHFLEHRMFETSRGDAMQEFEKLGVDANAETSHEYTSYYFETINNFDEGLKLLLEFTCQMNFKKESVQKEIQIILEEINGRNNRATAKAFDTLMNNIFSSNPLKHPIIGTIDSVSNTTYEELKQFYETFYDTSKLTLLLVGDIEESILDKLDLMLPSKHEHKKHKFTIKKKIEDEHVLKQIEIINFPVVTTLVTVGFKINSKIIKMLKMNFHEFEKVMRFFDELCFSSSSPLSEYLRKTRFSGLNISSYFVSYKHDGAFCIMFSHNEYQAVIDLIKQYLLDCRNLIHEEDFLILKKQFLGEWVINMHKSDTLYDLLIDSQDMNFDFLKKLKLLFAVTFEDVIKVIDLFLTLESSIVLVKGKKHNERTI